MTYTNLVHKIVQNSAVAIAALLALFSFFALANNAYAGIGVGVAPNFPGTVTVGDENVPVSLGFTNSPTTDVGDILITNIELLPQCGDLNSCAPDPGVFAVSLTGTGAGTCSGISFTISEIDAASGLVELVPDNPVILGVDETCIVNFTVDVLKMPTIDALGSAGIQTVQRGFVDAVDADGELPGNGVGTDVTTVEKANPEVLTHVLDGQDQDITNTTVPYGTEVRDMVAVSGAGPMPTGEVDFELYDNLTCDGQLLDTEADVPLDGNGEAYSTAFTPVAGTYSYLVHYSGDANYNAGTALCEPFTIVAPLEISKTAVPSIDEGYRWEITKSVSPAEWNLFMGDSGTSEYTIEVDRVLDTTSYSVTGVITVYNPNNGVSAMIESVSDVITGGVVPSLDCGVTFPYELVAGDTLECSYSSALPDSSARLNTATVETSGMVAGGSAEAGISFAGVVPDQSNGDITVDDTFNEGDAGPFSDSASYTYERTFVCGMSGGEYEGVGNVVENTATIVETGAYDDASVTVNCYDLEVTKTAEGTFDRKWEWTIDKNADKSMLELEEGESATVNYTVTVDAEPMNVGYGVSGEITIANNHPSKDAVLLSVTDLLDGSFAGDVSCPSMTVPAGGTLVCTYTADTQAEMNSAVATQQNYYYDSALAATVDGTTEYTGSAAVGVVPGDEVDECIDINDTNVGFLGTVCAGEADKTFEYSLTFGTDAESDVVLEECSEDSHPNTADFVTNDTGTTGDDSWTVSWAIECQQFAGCTPGYWKNNWWSTDASAEPTFNDMYSSLFSVPGGSYGTWTLVNALGAQGGGWNALVRSATAAYLNATFLSSMSDYEYPMSAADIVSAVNGLTDGATKNQINALKDELDMYNNLGCSLDAHGEPIMLEAY